MDWCRGCGSRTPTDATFCPSCGVRLPTDGAQRTAHGWYPDPAGIAPLRWWTGECWTSIVIDHPQGAPVNDGTWGYDIAPTWVPDPWRRAPWRWWDGVSFTANVSEGTTVWQDAQAGGGW